MSDWRVESDGADVLYRPVPRLETGRWQDERWHDKGARAGGFVAARLRKVGRRWKYTLRPHPSYDAGVHTALSMSRHGAMLEAERAAEAAETALRLGREYPEWNENDDR